jgi:hypothetical protein
MFPANVRCGANREVLRLETTPNDVSHLAVNPHFLIRVRDGS